MKYAKEQRIRFIDFLLFHYGHIRRKTLMDYFGTESATATKDIETYRTIAPNNIEYSTTDKVYKRTLEFKRVYE
jgi:hypothetical protein